jgi:hypothetical protein
MPYDEALAQRVRDILSNKSGYALAMKHARPMDFTGRPMVGMTFVSPEGVQGDAPQRNWVEMAAGHVSTLPAKKPRGGTAGTGKKKSAGASGTARPKK